MRQQLSFEPTAELNKALGKLQRGLKMPRKNKDGHFGKYADLSAVVESYILANTDELGLSFTQHIISESDANGKDHLQVATVIHHSSGEHLVVEGLPFDKQGDAQKTAGQLTYAKRYSLTTALGIVADEDDDGTKMSALQAELAEQERKRVGSVAKLKEVMSQIPKDRWEMIWAVVGKTKGSINDLERLDAKRINMMLGASGFILLEGKENAEKKTD